MSCQELVEQITEYREGKLGWWKRRQLEKHLRACDGCTAYVDGIEVTIRSLADLPAPPADPRVREQLLAAFRESRA